MIVLDLEWNSGRYGGRINEILQIGAVKLDRLGGRVTDSFCAYIHPRVHNTYSPAAAVLPELSLALNSPQTFPAAMKKFIQWCGSDTEFAAWGTADFLVLRENLRYWGMRDMVPDHFTDLQYAFALAAGARNSPALEPAVDYCRIPETFDFHNALYDSLYTALVGGCLLPGEIAAGIRKPGEAVRKDKGVTRLGLPVKKDGVWFGPYATVGEALDARACRRGACPVCGRVQRTSEWASDDGKYFYASLNCPAHGDYILRLETAVDKRRRIWGYPEVGETTPANTTLLSQAREGTVTGCKPLRSGSRSRRRRRRPKSQGQSAPQK